MAGRTTVCPNPPLTIFREVDINWETQKFSIDLEELARLRAKGLKIKELVKHFECGNTTIFEALRRLRKQKAES